MSRHHRPSLLVAAAACLPTAALLLSASPAVAAPVTPGDLVVYRVGDGAAALTSSATAVFLDEYTLTPAQTVPVQSLAAPTTGAGNQRRLTSSGTATSEGLISRTADGTGVLLTGYDATPGLASVAGTAASATNRVVGLLTADGTLDTSTALSDQPSGNNVRSAAGVTAALPSAGTAGSSVTVAGASGGLRTTTLGAQGTSGQANTDLTNIRQVLATDGKTFLSTGSGSAVRLGYLNGSTITPLPGLPTSTGSPYAFALLDLVPGVGYAGGAADTLYVADETPGTVTKYAYSAGTGSFAASGSTTLAGVRGLAARVVPGGVQLVLSNGTSLATLTDTSTPTGTGTLSGTPTTLATAPTNTAFRGVAFAPAAAPTTPPTAVPELSRAALLPLAGLGLGLFAWSRRRRSALA